MSTVLVSASRSAKPHQRTLRWPVIVALLWTATPASADIYAIDTSGARWRPQLLFIPPGQTVVWHGMESHETQLIDGLAPARTTGWRYDLDGPQRHLESHSQFKSTARASTDRRA